MVDAKLIYNIPCGIKYRFTDDYFFFIFFFGVLVWFGLVWSDRGTGGDTGGGKEEKTSPRL